MGKRRTCPWCKQPSLVTLGLPCPRCTCRIILERSAAALGSDILKTASAEVSGMTSPDLELSGTPMRHLSRSRGEGGHSEIKVTSHLKKKSDS